MKEGRKDEERMRDAKSEQVGDGAVWRCCVCVCVCVEGVLTN